MTPDVVVDIGNSRMKWGRVIGSRVVETVSLAHDEPVGWKRQAELWHLSKWAHWVIASVSPRETKRFTDWLDAGKWTVVVELTNGELLANAHRSGLRTSVGHPNRIGIDRLLSSLAAKRQGSRTAPAVAISVGTAMTLDFVEPDGTHVGGAILPGPQLMAKSLHNYTAKLPLIDIDPVLPQRAWGTDTESAIELGIANAVLGVADQMVWDWAERWPLPWVFVTGGDAGYFRGFVFTADTGKFVIDPHLTLEGIRIAAEALP